jgi:hypothetical protein
MRLGLSRGFCVTQRFPIRTDRGISGLLLVAILAPMNIYLAQFSLVPSCVVVFLLSIFSRAVAILAPRSFSLYGPHNFTHQRIHRNIEGFFKSFVNV